MKLTALVAAGFAVLAAPALALADDHISGDAANGEKVFRKCQACHQVGAEAKSKSGPILNGIIDRQAGINEDFKYSKVMIAAGEEGLVWSVENLDEYLANPRKFMKGTRMSFAGLRKDSDRADLIASRAGFQ